MPDVQDSFGTTAASCSIFSLVLPPVSHCDRCFDAGGRAERETAYDSRKSEMGKWVAPVQANRKAETLDFTPTVRTCALHAPQTAHGDRATLVVRAVLFFGSTRLFQNFSLSRFMSQRYF